jgi:hypothetical protein
MPRNNIQRLMLAVNQLSLPDEVKPKLMDLVIDDPPPASCVHIGDVLAHKVLKLSVDPNESETQRHLRVCFYALVFFPGEWIADHHYLSWRYGRKINPGADEVVAFRRNQRKHTEKQLKEYGLANVAFIRLNATAVSTTTSGFRLTCSASDHLEKVNRRDRHKAEAIIVRLTANLSPDRIQQCHLSDPAQKAELAEMQAAVKELEANQTITRGLLPTKKPTSGSGSGSAQGAVG